MRHKGAIIAVAVTALVVIAIASFSLLPATEADAATGTELPAPVAAPARDLGAVQAAFAAREALIQTQVQQLDRELTDRQTAYEARLAELGNLVATGDAQLVQLRERETALQAQVEELRAAQVGRGALYESQRGQAYGPYQVALQQLQIQLDVANAKLAEARAQLGQ